MDEEQMIDISKIRQTRFLSTELCLIPDEVADPKPPSDSTTSSTTSLSNGTSASPSSATPSPHGSLVQIISMERHKHPLLERLLDLERLQIDTIREECERRREFRFRVSKRVGGGGGGG